MVNEIQAGVPLRSAMRAVQAMLLAAGCPEPDVDARELVHLAAGQDPLLSERLLTAPQAAQLQADAYPALIWYEKIPESITSTTEADYELELPEKAVLAMAYYIAAQCNSMEYDQRFFQSFFAQYQGKLANLAADSTGPEFTATASSNLPDWM